MTGGGGFLGGHLIRKAEGRFRVFATWHDFLPDDKQAEWIRMDLADTDRIERVLRRVEPDVIIHTAALSRVADCERSPALASILNEHAAAALARACASVEARLLALSTDLVFDGLHPPYTESSPVSPVNTYARSKAAGELAVARHSRDFAIIRPALMYGSPAIAGRSFSEWLRSEWSAGRSTALYRDQHRTPIYVEDLAGALLDLAEGEQRGTFHLAGPERISRLEFGRLLAAQLGFGGDLIRSALMREVKVPGNRSPDVSLCTEHKADLPRWAFSGCREGLRRAYSGSDTPAG